MQFNREIIRIFNRTCVSCHGKDSIAMSLATYRDVRPWARAIREELVEQRMPPWSAARGYARFEGDISLTPRELSTILTWVDGGLPKGDERDLPPPPSDGAAGDAQASDHRVELPLQQVPGDGTDVIRRVVIDSGLTTDRWVRSIQVRPGDRRLLRAAFVSVLSTRSAATWAGAWTPWQTALTAPEGAAFLVRARSRFAIELHYRGGDASAVDRSAIAMVFAPDGVPDGQRRAMTSVEIETGRVVKDGDPPRSKGEAVLEQGAFAWGLRSELPADGLSLEVTARRPNASAEVLLWIPRYRSEWPAPYVFTRPVWLPAGTVLSVTAAGTPHPPRARAIVTLYR